LTNIDIKNIFRMDSTWGTGRSIPNNMRHMMIKVTGLMFVIYEILSLYHSPSPRIRCRIIVLPGQLCGAASINVVYRG
jgi:hypothetical protein